jgi:carbamoyl-phosphate synthase large subunit
MKVLVTGVGGPAGRNVVNHSPERWEIVACDADPRAENRFASLDRTVSKFYMVPYAREEKKFIDAVKDIVSREKIDLIIPTVDEELVTFSNNNIPIAANVMISPYETVETCNDKYLFYERFREHGFSPMYVVTDSRDDLKEFGKDRILMKPRIGRGSRGIRSFENVDEIPDELINRDNVFCEYLPGYEYTADVLCDLNGNPIVIIPRKRLEVHDGVCVKGKMERNQEIIGNIEKMCMVLKFIGPINIQFKLDSNGKPKLVEANPRFSGGLPITIKAGVNTLELLNDLLEGRKITKEKLKWKEIEAVQEIERPDRGEVKK